MSTSPGHRPYTAHPVPDDQVLGMKQQPVAARAGDDGGERGETQGRSVSLLGHKHLHTPRVHLPVSRLSPRTAARSDVTTGDTGEGHKGLSLQLLVNLLLFQTKKL